MFSIRFSNNKFQCWHVEHSVMKKYKAVYWWGKMKKRERRERGKKGKAEKKRGGKGKRNRQLRAVMDSDTLALLRSECKGIESLQGSGSKGDASCTTRYNQAQKP